MLRAPNKKAFILLFLIIFPQHIFADAGPKPKFTYDIVYETTKDIDLIKGIQLESDDAGFMRYDTIHSEGAQGFTCFQDLCYAMAYSFKKYHRVILIFNDTVRVTPVFKHKSFQSNFLITVYEDRLEIEDKTTLIGSSAIFPTFLKALIITLIIELFVALLFLLVGKKPLKTLLPVGYANLLSIPLLWLLFPLAFSYHYVWIPEIIIFIAEAYFIKALVREKLSIRFLLIMSLIMNLASFIVGTMILLLSFIL